MGAGTTLMGSAGTSNPMEESIGLNGGDIASAAGQTANALTGNGTTGSSLMGNSSSPYSSSMYGGGGMYGGGMGMGGMYGGGMFGRGGYGMGGMGMGGMYGGGMYGGMNGQNGSTLERMSMYVYQLCEIAQMVEFNANGLFAFYNLLKNLSVGVMKFG